MKILDLILGLTLLVLGVWRILQTISMDLDYQVVIVLFYLIIGVLPGLAVLFLDIKVRWGKTNGR